MSNVYFTLSAQDLKSAIRKKVTNPLIAVSKNPVIMSKIANKANEIVTPYVPKKSGNLRTSAHVTQHARRTYLVWGQRGVGKTYKYAAYQHDSDDTGWKRTTPGTTSFWTYKIAPGTRGYRKLITYATPLLKKEVRKRGGR
jgi:hypothetical protein